MTMTPSPPRMTGDMVRPLMGTVLARPRLWWAALGALRRLAVPGWWRRAPYLPLPDARWWEFRMVTAYGRTDAHPAAEDVVSFLEWCRTTGGSARTDLH
jgi:hypothetical protein